MGGLSVDFFNPLKRLKLGSFKTIPKKHVKSDNVVRFSSQNDVFSKVAIIQKSRNVDLKEVFCYALRPGPWSIAYGSGDTIKTSKPSSFDQVPGPYAVDIDRTALVRKVRNKGVTIEEFADELLKYVSTSSSDARRIDIVFNVYRETLIKNAERGHREVGILHFKKIMGSQYIK